jgi:hypothetical protein
MVLDGIANYYAEPLAYDLAYCVTSAYQLPLNDVIGGSIIAPSPN